MEQLDHFVEGKNQKNPYLFCFGGGPDITPLGEDRFFGHLK